MCFFGGVGGGGRLYGVDAMICVSFFGGLGALVWC